MSTLTLLALIATAAGLLIGAGFGLLVGITFTTEDLSRPSKSSNSGSGPALSTLLTVLFVGLKLGAVGEVAGWSWWAVTAPTWLHLLFTVSVALSLVPTAVIILAIRGQ